MSKTVAHTKSDVAQAYMEAAFAVLREEGSSEKYFSMAVDVGQQSWGRFFGEFGDPNGLAIEIEKGSVPSEIGISLVIRRRKSFWSRLKEIWTEGWAIFRNKETRYTIHLADSQLTKFKDLLRNLQ